MTTPLPRRAALGAISLAAVAAPATAFRSNTDRTAQRSTIVTVILTRHAEKADEPGRDPGLSPKGLKRAKYLAGMLQGVGLTNVYSTDYQRTRLTVIPTAEAHDLEVATYDPRDLNAFARTLATLHKGSVALVAGHSNTTPVLARALRAHLEDLDPRGFLREDEYDRLIILTLLPTGFGDEPLMAAHSTLDLRIALNDG